MRKLGLEIGMVVALVGCSSSKGVEEIRLSPQMGSKPVGCTAAPEKRAYIVSRDSDDLTVVDLECLEIVGQAKLKTQNAHMAEMSLSNDEVYVSSAGTHEIVVVDATTLAEKTRVPMVSGPTHLTLAPKGDLLAVMVEGAQAVSFLDTQTKQERKRLLGFRTPHFMRFSPDGRHGFVANLGGMALTRVAMATLEVDGILPVEGHGGDEPTVEEEGGFADAQIDATGMLYAAHAETGHVVRYDTLANRRLPDLGGVGQKPWVVFAQHPFPNLSLPHLVPSFATRTLAFIDGARGAVVASLPGDRESYGVNYSPLAPHTAFVMNRVRQEVAVVDTEAKKMVASIDVGGNTETASTTKDGKYIVATVSSAHRVVVIDAVSRGIVKIFENVGRYPWSVVIPGGQNYCH